MKNSLFFFCLFTVAVCHAQDTLSYKDYKYSYKFNSDINPADSGSVAASFAAMAPQMYNDAKKYTEKPLRDSGLLNSVYNALVYGALYQKDYLNVLFYIEKARKLSYKKKYTAPPYLLEKAYAEASINPTEKISFDSRFEKSLLEDFMLMDRDFIKDEANRLKGAYGLNTVPVNKRLLEDYLKESLKADSSAGIYILPARMQLFFRNYIFITHQVLLQNVLQKLSPEKVEMQQVKIPMRDGIFLGGFLFRNTAISEKLPAIICQSPYPEGTEALHGNIFAVNGYAYLYVDCRGRRYSEGEFFPYENDAQDYYDIIDWASKQTWCNGKVGTTGGSYLGFTQWQAIRKKYRHPALKAINPMASVGFGVDFPMKHQVFDSYSLRWAVNGQGKELNDALFFNHAFWDQKSFELYKKNIPFSKFDSVVGMKNPFFTKWLCHPDFDSYWKNILPDVSDYKQLDIPVLTTTGYFDDDQSGALYYYRNHIRNNPDNKHYMIIGPFDHGGAQWMPGPSAGGEKIEEEAQIPLYKYVIQWFDWALKNKPLPSFYKDKINYYVTGANAWKGAAMLSGITDDSLKFYLTPKIIPGKTPLWQMQTKVSGDTVFSYSHDIYTTRDSLAIFAPGTFSDTDSFYKAYNAFNPGLAFETPVLQHDIVLTGTIVSHLFTSLNVPDADLEIYYTEVDSADHENDFAYDFLRTRYRISTDNPRLMIPGKASLLNFNTAFLKVQRLKKGHKIRIYISVKNDYRTEKNYGFGGVVSNETSAGPRIIKMSLYAGRRYPSYIAVPYQ